MKMKLVHLLFVFSVALCEDLANDHNIDLSIDVRRKEVEDYVAEINNLEKKESKDFEEENLEMREEEEESRWEVVHALDARASGRVCKGTGGTCKKMKQCCSRKCLGLRSRPHSTSGTCACSRRNQPCASDTGCCNSGTCVNGKCAKPT